MGAAFCERPSAAQAIAPSTVVTRLPTGDERSGDDGVDILVPDVVLRSSAETNAVCHAIAAPQSDQAFAERIPPFIAAAKSGRLADGARASERRRSSRPFSFGTWRSLSASAARPA